MSTYWSKSCKRKLNSFREICNIRWFSYTWRYIYISIYTYSCKNLQHLTISRVQPRVELTGYIRTPYAHNCRLTLCRLTYTTITFTGTNLRWTLYTKMYCSIARPRLCLYHAFYLVLFCLLEVTFVPLLIRNIA